MGITTLVTPVLYNHDGKTVGADIVMRPPAKLNLSLVVFDRRPDGFHDLHTVMATIDLCDDLRLRISEKPGIHLYCSGIECPNTRDNLVWRAAELLGGYAGVEPALDIFLNKRIPSGAGLGGASSDGAACLLGLHKLWALDMPREQLDSIAAELGSDVPFFLHSPVALCTGRGENIIELPHRCSRCLLLIISNIHTPTAKVYQNYKYDPAAVREDMRMVRYFLGRGDLDGLIGQGINSLTCATMALFEPLRHLRDQIEELGIGPVHMTGSGSCLFLAGETRDQTGQWARQIQKLNLAHTYEVSFYTHRV